ncbi:ABC transporter permease [Paludibacterium purpuratum]|uniref:Cu-processing system permease protein n=1 Tax=Paludibacterium purpuratum TaxID=1144873 RepID=A0A4R7B9H9_9NEIS|nr:ABC transporter permease subunit [Paludibacterium purpuratum]TDR81534.1 Cu-processing system permease protein [Paludibacterium purpuratum]
MTNLSTLHAVKVVAAKEFRDRIRSRWVLAMAVVFTIFTLAISFFGSAQQGLVGFQGIEPLIASLVSLAIYLLPLIALILGFDAIVGEKEKGTLNLLLSYPLSPLALLTGKYLGLALAMSCATLIGFGAAGAVIAVNVSMPAADWLQYAGFVVSALLLGLVFLSIAVALSVFCQSRTSASGLAIGIWFFFVLVFDLLLLGALVISGGASLGPLFPILLLLNPADIFRILNIFGPEDLHAMFGLISVFPPSLADPLLLGGIMVMWILSPLAIAAWRFKQ